MRRSRIGGWALTITHLGMAVYGHIGDPGQELCRAVLAAAELEQRRSFVNEARGVIRGDEIGMRYDIVEEGEIGRHSADAIFEERAAHAARRFLRRWRPGRHLLEQRVV